MEISKERIAEFKKLLEEQSGKEITDAEAYEGAHNLVGFFEVLLKCEQRDRQRQRRLKKEPEGFTLDDGEYTCSICHEQKAPGEIWYDKFGVTCALCRKAVQTGAVPAFACDQKDSWYPMWKLEDKFGIKHPL